MYITIAGSTHHQRRALRLVDIVDVDGEVAVKVLHRASDVLDQLIHHGHAHVLPNHCPQQLCVPIQYQLNVSNAGHCLHDVQMQNLDH